MIDNAYLTERKQLNSINNLIVVTNLSMDDDDNNNDEDRFK